MQEELPAEISESLKKLEQSGGIEKIDLLHSLATYYLDKAPEKAQQYAEEAKQLSQELKDAKRLGKSLLLLGKSHYIQLDFFSAIEHLTTCSILSESFGETRNEIEALTIIGISQSAMGDHARALDSHYKALKLSQGINDSTLESESLMQVGLSYLGNKENELALEYFTKSYNIRLKGDDKKALGSVTGNIGNIYVNIEQYEKAIEYYKKTYDIFSELDNPVGAGRAELNIGIALGALGRYEEALEYVNKGLKVFIELDKKEIICNTLSTLGSIYSEKGEPEKAIEYLKKAVTMGEKYNLRQINENTYGAMSDAAANTGDYKTAYEYHVKYHTLVDQRVKEAAEIKTRYLNVTHKVDSLKKESESLASKNAELKELNERLTQLNLEKNEFLGIAAHDLKNPLASISLSAATIKKYLDVFPKEKIESHLSKIEETSTRMKNIVTNLININAIETGEYTVTKKEIDLSSLLNYIIEDFRHRATNKNIELVFTNPGEIKITTDENALYSILDNLISNAIKYSSNGSFVFIKLSKTDKVTIKIKDNGLGIKDSEKQQVFQKFSRMSNKPTAGENSTGLGLSIVKRLTELIGGNITFESEFGKGTTFTVELPL